MRSLSQAEFWIVQDGTNVIDVKGADLRDTRTCAVEQFQQRHVAQAFHGLRVRCRQQRLDLIHGQGLGESTGASSRRDASRHICRSLPGTCGKPMEIAHRNHRSGDRCRGQSQVVEMAAEFLDVDAGDLREGPDPARVEEVLIARKVASVSLNRVVGQPSLHDKVTQVVLGLLTDGRPHSARAPLMPPGRSRIGHGESAGRSWSIQFKGHDPGHQGR